MMISWIVLALAFSAFLAFFLVAPYFDPAFAGNSHDSAAGSTRSLLDTKERALRAVKDLEFDKSMGKVSEEEFTKARQELLQEVAAILEETRGRAR
jgi:hypothetical protein